MPKKIKESLQEPKKEKVKQSTKTETKPSPKAKTKTIANNTKKTTSKTASKSKTTNKATKKASAKKAPAKKTTKTSSTRKKAITQSPIIEYYDLPNKYNQTIVKILSQTPKTLFIYWEISDDDIKKYKEQYGENFFETTKPILIIYNTTLNYSFEVEINDFANCWYLHINDSKSDYKVELARRPLDPNKNSKTNYIHIYTSNEIETPNDHVLFNTSQKMVYFKNLKSNTFVGKSLSSLSFIKNMGKVYNIYDIYKELYKNDEDLTKFSNPSSHR